MERLDGEFAALAAKVDELSQAYLTLTLECASLRREIAELRRGYEIDEDPVPEWPVPRQPRGISRRWISRRGLGKALGLAAVAAAIAALVEVELHAPAGGGAGVSTSGTIGVRGDGTGANGRGGVFSGAVAQVRLDPGSNPTHPESGSQGDLYADQTGRLWFCKKGGSAAVGNAAVWRQIA